MAPRSVQNPSQRCPATSRYSGSNKGRLQDKSTHVWAAAPLHANSTCESSASLCSGFIMAALSPPMTQARRAPATRASTRKRTWGVEGGSTKEETSPRLLPRAESQPGRVWSRAQGPEQSSLRVRTKPEAGRGRALGRSGPRCVVHQGALSMPGHPIP